MQQLMTNSSRPPVFLGNHRTGIDLKGSFLPATSPASLKATTHDDAGESITHLLNTITEAYYKIDLAGNFTGFNPKMVEILGYPAKDLLGMNYRVFMDSATARHAYGIFNHVYRTGRSCRGNEWQLIRKDGSLRSVKATISLIRDGQGHPVGFMGAVQDHTARQQLASLIRAKEHACQRHEERCHEMQTALRVLMSSQETLQEELAETMLTHVKSTVLPHLEWLLQKKLSPKARQRLLLAQSNLNNLMSPFARRMTSAFFSLTRTELEVADLVRFGRSNKEIAEILGLSLKTIETHRNRIRRKLGIANTRTNLRTYLQTLAD